MGSAGPDVLAGLLPKSFTGAAAMGSDSERGAGVIVGVIDSGVDWAEGLLQCPDGSPKIIDSYDCSGSGDVDTSAVQRVAIPAEDETAAVTLTLHSGRRLCVPPAWFARAAPADDVAGDAGDAASSVDSSGVKGEVEFHIGLKFGRDLYTPGGVADRVARERKDAFVAKHQALVVAARQAVSSLESIEKRGAQQERELKDARSRLSVLEGLLADDFDDPGPIFDVVVFSGSKDVFRVAVISEEVDCDDVSAVSEIPLLTDYRKEHQFACLNAVSRVNYSVNVWDAGNRVEIVTPSSAHGTHVAGIIGAYYGGSKAEATIAGGEVARNGVAPACKIVNIRIADMRFGGDLEVNWAMARACEVASRTGCHVVNMSFGEPGAMTGERSGRACQLLQRLVEEQDILFVNSASNDGPALHTTGMPASAVGDSLITVAAHLFPEMAASAYNAHGLDPQAFSPDRSARQILEEQEEADVETRLPPGGIAYPWSSRGPTADGDYGVTVTAPGGAIAPVPQAHLQHSQLMNGTSMSAPNCAGSLAVLLGKLKEDSIPYTASSIRRAIQNTASRLPVALTGKVELESQENQLLPISQGAGMLQVDRALEFCKRFPPNVHLRWKTTVPTRENARGILLREAHETSVKHKIGVFVEPVFRTAIGTENVDSICRGGMKIAGKADLIAFDRQIRLETTADWVSVPKSVMIQSPGRMIECVVDPVGLAPDFSHVAEIFGYDSAEDSAEAGPIFRFCVTVVKPLLTDWKNSTTRFSTKTRPGEIVRRFLVPPAGATECHVKVRHVDARLKTSDLDVSQTAALFEFGGHQVLPQNPPGASCGSERLAVRPGDSKSFVLPVTGGFTLEFMTVQYWISLGFHTLDFEMTWHGVNTTPGGSLQRGQTGRAAEAGPSTSPALAYDSSRGAVRIDVSGFALHSTEIAPTLKLEKVRRLFSPKSSSVSPWISLDSTATINRNALIRPGQTGGLPVYQMKNCYSFDAKALASAAGISVSEKPASITCRVWFPVFDVQLYDSCFGGCIWQVFNSVGKLLSSGEYCASDALKIPVSSTGSMTFSVVLTVFHEDPKFLESAVSDVALAVDVDLATSIAVPVGSTLSAAAFFRSATGSHAVGPSSAPLKMTLRPSSTVPLWLGAPKKGSIPSGAANGDVLLGRVRYLDADAYPNVYDLVEYKVVSSGSAGDSSVASTGAPKTAEDLSKQNLDLTVAYLGELDKAAKASTAESGANAAEADSAFWTVVDRLDQDEIEKVKFSLYQVMLSRRLSLVETSEPATKAALIEKLEQLCDQIVQHADSTKVAAFFGTRHDLESERDEKAAKSAKEDMDTRREALVSVARARCISALAEESLDKFATALDELRRWIAADDSKHRSLFFLLKGKELAAKSEISVGLPDWSVLLKQVLEGFAAGGNTDRELLEAAARCCKELGFHCWEQQFSQRLVRDFPKSKGQPLI